MAAVASEKEMTVSGAPLAKGQVEVSPKRLAPSLFLGLTNVMMFCRAKNKPYNMRPGGTAFLLLFYLSIIAHALVVNPLRIFLKEAKMDHADY
jgi:hypothetical protein